MRSTPRSKPRAERWASISMANAVAACAVAAFRFGKKGCGGGDSVAMRRSEMNRREFLTGVVCLAAAPYAAKAMGAAVTVDRNLSAFLSDIHVSGWNVKGQPTYQNPLFEKAVDQVLAMNPRPARVVVFGDVALWTGRHEDYEASLPGLKRLTDAGVELYLTTGNHDHREVMFRYHPRQKEITPVEGRFVSVVDLGEADLFLMDTLKESPKGEGFGNAVDGALDAAQQEWLQNAAAAAKRPYFIGAHHAPEEIKVGDKDIRAAFEDDPHFAGYIHGHKHRWYKQWFHRGYSKRHVVRSACLPSTGWWGTIGFATMRTFADRAELKLVQNDFFFPKPLKDGEKRPREWDEILKEDVGDVCTFTW